MEIKGSKGSMIVTDQTLDIYDLNGEKQKSYAYPQLYTGTFMDIGGSLFSEQMQCFLERISYDDFNKGEGCTPEQALYVQRVVEAIYQSNLEKSKVQIRG